MVVIKGQLDAEGIRVDHLTNDINSLKSSNPLNSCGGNGSTSSPEICRLEGLISGVSNRVNKFDNLNDSDSIKFGGMGLRSKREVIVWLAINSPRERGGLIVDFHTLMEHIYHSTTGSDAITKLNGLYKLKIGTISQGLAITSFDCNIPKFFSCCYATWRHSDIINIQCTILFGIERILFYVRNNPGTLYLHINHIQSTALHGHQWNKYNHNIVR